MDERSGRAIMPAARREINDIIKTCEAIKERRFNPFFLDVAAALATLRKYFPFWRAFEDLCADAQAINRLSEVIRLQNLQLRFQSSSLYLEPEFLQQKLNLLTVKELSGIFLKSWHPAVELEQLTPASIRESILYWNGLLPLAQRLRRRGKASMKPPTGMGIEDLMEIGILTKEQFGEMIGSVWQDLKSRADQEGKVEYWSFIRGADFQEAIRRAYYVSFLVTYGHARLVKSGGRLYLLPSKAEAPPSYEKYVSLPISIRREALAA